MQKRIKKIKIIFMAFIVLTFIIAGCADKNQDADSVSTDGESKYASDKPLDLTIHLHYYNSTVFNDDWLVFKEAAKRTNITLAGTATQSATDSNQVFNIMMASKELPDIIHTQRLKAIQY